MPSIIGKGETAHHQRKHLIMGVETGSRASGSGRVGGGGREGGTEASKERKGVATNGEYRRIGPHRSRVMRAFESE
jgi:hypothetical protein